MDLIAEMGLSQEAFSARFKGSPIKRTKRNGYLRNVAVALGNLGEEGSLPALTQALQDPDSLVQNHAGWAIEKIKLENARGT